jgi:hypothetical protein
MHLLLPAALLAGAALATPVAFPFPKTTVAVDNDTQTLASLDANLPGGEAQSAVVAPGLKTQCPNGRFLVTNDSERPDSGDSAKGLVSGRNLDGGAIVRAKFTTQPATPANYAYGTNDHDLVVLNNGDVLYATGAFTKAPLAKKPIWFDSTFRSSFGPGARSNVLVWKSTDCGETFQFLSEMDPALVEDGTCANPQKVDPTNAVPGQRFDMGGSDGQTLYYDRESDALYLAFQCVGYEVVTVDSPVFTAGHEGPPKPGSAGSIVHTKVPALGKKITNSLFLSSKDGAAWHSLGWVPNFLGWRTGIVPLGAPGTAARGSSMAWGAWGYLAFASRKMAVGPATPHTRTLHASYGWDPVSFLGLDWGKDLDYFPTPCDAACKQKTDTAWNARDESKVLATAGHVLGDQSPGALIYSNVVVNMLTLRGHDAQSVYAVVPARVGATDGYRVISVERATGTATELAPIVSTTNDGKHFVMRAVAADLGSGPLLVYWMDVDAAGKTATIRGRFLNVGSAPGGSTDFVVARTAGNTRTIALDAPGAVLGLPIWYGDYQTAGGFSATTHQGSVATTERAFYPMWVEPDGSRHYTAVHHRVSQFDPVVRPGQKLVTLGQLPPGKTVALKKGGAFTLPAFADKSRTSYRKVPAKDRIRLRAAGVERPK